MNTPTIYRLTIERYRGIRALSWNPSPGVNVILGGGNVGKTTILEALGLLLSPTNSTAISDLDYYQRNIDSEFAVEAVFSLPPECGVHDQYKHLYPWLWDGKAVIVPTTEEENDTTGEPVYRLRVRGTPELELVYEVVQPNDSTDTLPVGLRRSIGLVRISGDDRNDSNLRLVRGSALDRLLHDKSLRSRISNELSKSKITDVLSEEAKMALNALDEAFETESLPTRLDIGVTGSQGFSIAALIGLTAMLGDIPLPLASWGSGTRRLASLTIAGQTQATTPITLVDEVERGLEPYRQRYLLQKLQGSTAQVFLTTHSPAAVAAASKASLWYVDHEGQIGPLRSTEVSRQREKDPESFLSRLTIVAEGKTEQGFVMELLERSLDSPLEQHGIHVSDGGGHDPALGLLEALVNSGLHFGGFADHEGRHPTRWNDLGEKLGPLLFRWAAGCTEDNVINAVPAERLEELIIDPKGNQTGVRLRTLKERLGTADKDFVNIKEAAGPRLKEVILEAARGDVPGDKTEEKKIYQKHGQDWFKTVAGGRELARKVFELGTWPVLRSVLLPFCNAVRTAIHLPNISDIDT